MQQNMLLFTACMLVLLSVSSCKKEKQPAAKQLPVLGTCKPVVAVGGLSFTNAAGPYTFRTKGGGTIVINAGSYITITHDSYPGFKIELWGAVNVNGVVKTSANHENMNGKHIKDRLDTRRTIIFPDGAKFTLVADGAAGPLRSVSFYDGAESHHINPTCNTLEHSSTTEEIARQLDDAEPDGETSTFEFTTTGLLFVNVYTEDSPGNKVMKRYLLGELFRSEPNRVNDHYDDPRLAAT